jgi:CRISPR-associated protein Cmr6
MRDPDHQYKDGTKTQTLQLAQDKAKNYHSRLSILNERTKLMAEVSFEVKSSWRLRVGGHRGPESILLPAFDALGMPYLPSSSLRGVARTYAIRELMKDKGMGWKEAQKAIAPYFGSIETKNEADKAGKVVFFDAYPKQGCLEMDMANNIWQWEGNELKYSPNPNPFFSLKEATFVIGLKLAGHCQDRTVLDKVKQWLIKGLQEGIGSQINSGYGQLIPAGAGNPRDEREFLQVELGLQGQLIHGYQKFTQWNWNDQRNEWQMRGSPVAEVRSTAFKSMLRYWFRAFALGVLPVNAVREWEGKLFGSINPNQNRGYVKCNILEGKLVQREPRPNHQGRNDDCGEQSGILILAYSTEAPANQHRVINELMSNLTWMMLNLGGIGQGARRPNYSRSDRQNAPWWRGSTFFIDSQGEFWSIADNAQKFQRQFRIRLTDFYQSLGQLIGTDINYQNPRHTGTVTNRDWIEAVDANCRIVVCSGDDKNNKPYGLAVLHSQQLKRNNDYDGDLCGKVRGGVKPSPVWVADGGDYQVITVFGATQNPRKKYLEQLKDKAQSYHQIFPF